MGSVLLPLASIPAEQVHFRSQQNDGSKRVGGLNPDDWQDVHPSQLHSVYALVLLPKAC